MIQPTTRTGTFQVLQRVPHDATAFTQGLVVTDDGRCYEGTGLYGKSEVRAVDLTTGAVLHQTQLAPQYFGEGIAHYYENADKKNSGRIVQLTWREATAFVYDSESLSRLSSFSYQTTNSNQGWGITVRGDSQFVVSDGSEYLHFWDVAETWAPTGRVAVVRRGETSRQSVRRLNELEWDPFTDTVLANVWQTDVIVRIDPESGVVLTEYDLRSLFPYNQRPAGTNVLNGIAVVPGVKDEFWITGKLWPYMFRVRLS